MKLTIEKIENGFILSWNEEVDDDKFIERKEVIEESLFSKDYRKMYKTDDDEKIMFARMLEKVSEYFGELYDKYSESNLKIIFNNKGHKL